MSLSNCTILLSKTFDSRLHFLFFSVLTLLGIAQPIYAVSSGITYAGRILDLDDAPVTASSVIFTVTIYDPSEKCWLYSEQRNLDLSQTAGTFSFEIGSSDTSNLYGAAPIFNNHSSGGPTNLAELFSNKKSFTGLGTANGCTGSYDPTLSTDPNEGRLLSVYFRVGASGVDQAIPPMRITAVPLAMQALAINGYGTGELLRVDKSIVASSGFNNDPLSLAQYTEFWSLVNKSSASYLPVTGDTNLVGGNNKLTSLLGQTLPAGPATSGQVLVSNGTIWTLQSMSGGGGSVGSVGGTSPISVGGTATAPVISLPAAGTSVDGYLTSTDWNTFNAKQSSSLSAGKVFVGNASGVATEVSLSGDATITSGGVLTVNKTTTGEVNKLLSLDGTGVAISKGNQLNGNISGSVTLLAAGATTNYSLTFPAAQGNAGQTLANNGSGILSWASALTNSLTSGKILLGNASNVSAEVSLSGDATLDNAGVVTVDKTQVAVANKILQLTASSVAVTKGTDIGGAGTGVAHILYPNTATNTTLTLPSSAGSANQVLQTDGAGVLTWVTPLNTNTTFVNGGNTFAGNSSIGNNDNYNLSFKTNGATRMTVLNSGSIGIGTASPTASLEVAGAIRTPTVSIAAGTTTLDLSQSNFFSVSFTTNTCTALTLDNLLDGGSYTIATSGATSGTCSFTATGLTFKYAPTNAAVTTDSIYTMVRVGSIVYVSWITGFQ